ncbi:MAG TPA: M28 family peptidase [Solirubrobacteraceae bacterium]|nr:M28 family peptidase [Solirubrobacteraceae bacterium]
MALEEATPATSEDYGPWEDAIHELAAFERPSASEGERRAAEWIAQRLRELGCMVEIEQERAHGGYWWPLALANLLGAGAALAVLFRGGRKRRALAALAAGTGAAAVWDDVSGGRLWFRRALLPHRPTWNVVAETGDRSAERTVVVLAHHDAAHSGLVFHPALGEIGPRLAPEAHAKSSHTFPIMYLVLAGPVLALAGAILSSKRTAGLGLAFGLGTAATMTDIGLGRVVPGANDNLTAVAILVALAHALRERPVEGVRVLLVSTGSEESFMEGMQGFARRHFSGLDPARTEMLCLECLGGPHLIVLEGEGMLRMRDYTSELREALADAANRAGVDIGRGIRTVAATDGLIALRAGYPTATLASVTHAKLPLNYHWPSDTPAALHWDTVRRAIVVCEQFLRRRARPDRL